MDWQLLAASASACPFCTAVKPTFAQQRDAAAVVALVERTGVAGDKQVFRVDQVLKGKARLQAGGSLTVRADAPEHSVGLLLMMGSGPADAAVDGLEWTCTPVNETSYAYFARSPELRMPSAQRLRYFAPYLEHADPLIAEDAFLEFGKATVDDVRQVADLLPMERLRAWAVDPAIPQGRKGFYALALGMAMAKADKEANTELLRRQILAPASDFRAGFDGMIAGYLLLGGEPAVQLIDERYLSDPKAADGDVRHALSALRFYQEFGAGANTAKLAAALEHLLARPEFAATVIADLARWQDWNAAERIASLYERPDYANGETRRAIVAYLRVCPLPKTAAELERLRKLDPRGVSEAEQSLGAAATGVR